MKLVTDLALAFAASLALGVGGMLAMDSFSFLVPVAAVVAGVGVLVVRRGANVIPVASVFSVLMFGVLLWLGFVIAWNRGLVEF